MLYHIILHSNAVLLPSRPCGSGLGEGRLSVCRSDSSEAAKSPGARPGGERTGRAVLAPDRRRGKSARPQKKPLKAGRRSRPSSFLKTRSRLTPLILTPTPRSGPSGTAWRARASRPASRGGTPCTTSARRWSCRTACSPRLMAP